MNRPLAKKQLDRYLKHGHIFRGTDCSDASDRVRAEISAEAECTQEMSVAIFSYRTFAGKGDLNAGDL